MTPAGRTDALAPPPWWRSVGLLAITRAPLTRNGYSLIFNTGVTSALGIVYWVVASRSYSPQEVGVATSLLAVLTGVGGVAQLAFANLLNRFLPAAGARRKTLIAQTSIAAVVYSVALALGFVASAPWIAPALHRQLNQVAPILWFAAAAALWTLFNLQDSALTGLHRSALIPLKNSTFGLVKLALLAPLAGTALFGSGIFTAWTLPLPIFVVAAHRAIARRLADPLGPDAAATADTGFSTLARFLGWDYVGTLAMIVAGSASQIAVLDVAGAVASANYNLATTIAFSIYLIGRSMSSALLAQSAAETGRVRALASDAVAHSLIILAPAVALVVLGAPVIMGLFGPNYAVDGAPLLRVLALTSVPWALTSIYLAIARVEGHLVPIAVIQAGTASIALAAGIPLLHWAGGLGMAWAWFIAQSSVAASIVVYVAAKNGRGHIVDWGLNLAGSFGKLAHAFAFAVPKRRDPPVETERLLALLRRAGAAKSGSAFHLIPIATQSDVWLAFVAWEDSRERVVYKASTSARGGEAMRRAVHAVGRLNADPRIEGSRVRLPEVLAFESDAGRCDAIERALPGEDGRALVLKGATRESALAAAAAEISRLHGATAQAREIDEDWLVEWIDEPARRIAECAMGVSLSPARRRRALDSFVSEQRRFWSGRTQSLGLSHGDYFPGNVLYTRGEPDESLRVSAILDWETMRENGPEGFDICHLLLTTRALTRGQDLGKVVVDNLRAPHWTPEEERVIASLKARGPSLDWSDAPRSLRALTCLAWLHHADGNCRKSDVYRRSRLWSAGNIERVLMDFSQPV